MNTKYEYPTAQGSKNALGTSVLELPYEGNDLKSYRGVTFYLFGRV